MKESGKMQKIMEEIDAHATEFELFGAPDDYISIGWAKDIIRKHMNEIREDEGNDSRLTIRPLVHKHEEYPEHQWIRNENGNIDHFAMEVGYCNGPVCKRCGYSFCEHCEPDGWDKRLCVIDEYYCPNCGRLMHEKDKFCRNCGQAILQEG